MCPTVDIATGQLYVLITCLLFRTNRKT